MYVVNEGRTTLKEPRQEMMGGKYLLELAGRWWLVCLMGCQHGVVRAESRLCILRINRSEEMEMMM